MRLVAGLAVALALATPAPARACVIHRGRPPPGPIEALVAADDAAALVAVADGIVVRSADEGLSWEVAAELEPDEEEEPEPTSITAAGARVAVARGAQLLLSDDGGRSFLSLELPLSEGARAIAFVDGGTRLLVAHGESLARLEVGPAGVHLVADGRGPGEVVGLAAGPTGVFAIVEGEILRSADGGETFRHAPQAGRARVDDPPRALAVDGDGGHWIVTTGGVWSGGVDGDEARRLELGPGLADPSAIAPGRGDALFVVDGGELAEVRLVCSARRAPPPLPELVRARRIGRRVVRGLLPRLVFDLRAGPGALAIAFELAWPLLPPDHRETEAWTAAGEGDAAEDRRLLALRVTAAGAWAEDGVALEAPAGAVDRALLGRAARALEARATIELLEAEWP